MGFRCLVRDQEVDGSNPFAPTIISPLNSILYGAFATVTSGPDLGTTGTTEGFSSKRRKTQPNLLRYLFSVFHVFPELRIRVRDSLVRMTVSQ
jgi:hypothetical protein